MAVTLGIGLTGCTSGPVDDDPYAVRGYIKDAQAAAEAYTHDGGTLYTLRVAAADPAVYPEPTKAFTGDAFQTLLKNPDGTLITLFQMDRNARNTGMGQTPVKTAKTLCEPGLREIETSPVVGASLPGGGGQWTLCAAVPGKPARVHSQWVAGLDGDSIWIISDLPETGRQTVFRFTTTRHLDNPAEYAATLLDGLTTYDPDRYSINERVQAVDVDRKRELDAYGASHR